MIKATCKKDETEIRFKGTAEEIHLEMVAVLANGCISTSKEKSEEDVTNNFISVVLTAMGLLEEKGIKIDTEIFKKTLEVRSRIDVDEVINAIEKLIGAIKGEEPNGK